MAIRLGGPVFNSSDDPVELARAHRKLGYRAAYCPRVALEDKQRIAAIEKAFKAEDVVIAEVGVWVNIMHKTHKRIRSSYGSSYFFSSFISLIFSSSSPGLKPVDRILCVRSVRMSQGCERIPQRNLAFSTSP